MSIRSFQLAQKSADTALRVQLEVVFPLAAISLFMLGWVYEYVIRPKYKIKQHKVSTKFLNRWVERVIAKYRKPKPKSTDMRATQKHTAEEGAALTDHYACKQIGVA